MPLLDLTFESGEESLSVRSFSVHEKISSLFQIEIIARSTSEDLELSSLVGHKAAFRIVSGVAHVARDTRRWDGLCTHIELQQVETTGLSTYLIRIAPRLWLSTQRRNHRLFQQMSIPDIVDRILTEWRIEREWTIDRGQYPKLDLRVQYGETDYAFLSRLLEEAGITFFFQDRGDNGSALILHDRPHGGDLREAPPIAYVDNPLASAEEEYVTHIRLTENVLPGRFTIRDHDFRRRADYPLYGAASAKNGPEEQLELYTYAPGSFLAVSESKPGDTPVADDRGAARHEDKTGKRLAELRLEAIRVEKREVTFATNVMDLAPGALFSIDHHPRVDLRADKRLLATELSIEGSFGDEWRVSGKAVFASQPYRPPQITPKPQVFGIQSAIVVGPNGEEIHTDELGRIRVQFHWDREGKRDPHSSCWMRVSQGWAGAGFGMITIPRIGQEVLVAFLEGNPDHPVVVGRLFNSIAPVPYKLPEQKTVSGWKSSSTPGSTGFNEIRFDDAKGGELVSMQAERNLKKLVKRHERETTGRTRTIRVGRKLTLTTGKASITLDGPNITMQALGHIRIKSTRRYVTLKGAPHVRINPLPPRKFGLELILSPEAASRVVEGFGTQPYIPFLDIKGTEVFRARVREALDRLRKTWAVRGLFMKLVRRKQAVLIAQTRALNGFARPQTLRDANMRSERLFGRGTGTLIFWNAAFRPGGVPSDLVLGRLLIQALRNAGGRRLVGSTQGVRMEDLRVTGLAPYSMRSPTENSLRREMKLPLRASF